jgi:hypothetical protein
MSNTSLSRRSSLREKPHPNKASALKRAVAIYRWRLNVLFIEGSNGERIEASEINVGVCTAEGMATAGYLER